VNGRFEERNARGVYAQGNTFCNNELDLYTVWSAAAEVALQGNELCLDAQSREAAEAATAVVSAVLPGTWRGIPAPAAGSTWVFRQDDPSSLALVSIDGASGDVLTEVALGQPFEPWWQPEQHVAAAGDQVWFALEEGGAWSAARLDPRSGRIEARVPLAGRIAAMTMSAETLWVSAYDPGRLVGIDLEKAEVVAEFRTLSPPILLNADEDSVWAVTHGNQLVHLDPASGKRQVILSSERRLALPLVLGDEVWVAAPFEEQVIVLDRSSGEVLERVRVGGPSTADGPRMMALHGGEVWAADGLGKVKTIDPSTREITRELHLPGLFHESMVADGDGLWVVSGAGLLRIGS
jgi:hypothetical protein